MIQNHRVDFSPLKQTMNHVNIILLVSKDFDMQQHFQTLCCFNKTIRHKAAREVMHKTMPWDRDPVVTAAYYIKLYTSQMRLLYNQTELDTRYKCINLV